MASQSRKHRGYQTQRMVAEWFKEHGWPHAYSKGAGESGVDIENMAGLSPEVKARPGDVTGALQQAIKNAGKGLPFVVWRPNGYGPERIKRWPVIVPLEEFTKLLLDAGYGDSGEVDDAVAKIARIKAALANHPKVCERYTDDDVLSCGWKRIVQDIVHALEDPDADLS